ncbi:MAG: phage minor head protein [Moraxella sp.]|nr:phage minor head protein [Moraxella sp.]
MGDKALVGVQSAFDLPFDEQIEFFKQKVRLSSRTYQELTAQNHDKAFVVAGAMKADLLNDLHKAVLSAIQNGEALWQFAKNFDTIVKKHGWLGDKDQNYTAWRAKIIYQTNLRTSHSVGRYHQMTDPDVLKARPYWQYRHITADNPRLHHKRLNNMVLWADDVWWTVNYPPNGWGCKCYARSLSQADMDRMGLSVSQTPDMDGYADRSFAHAHGSSWYPNLDKYPYAIAKAMVASNMTTGVLERWLGRIKTQLDDHKANTPDYDTLKKEERIVGFRKFNTGESFQVAVLSEEQQAILGVQTRTVLFSEDDALKQAISRDGNTGFDASSYHQVQHLIDNATLIVREYDKKNDGYRQQTTWVEGFNADGKRYLAIIHQTKTGDEVYLKSYRLDRASDEKLKSKGKVLFTYDSRNSN